MKNNRHSPEQIVRKLHQADDLLATASSAPEICKQLKISEATYQRWRNQYGGMKQDAIKRLRELEKENERLKKVVAEQALDIQILKEVQAEKTSEPEPEKSGRSAHPTKAQGLRASGLCRVMGQPSSTQRYVGRKVAKDRLLAERMVALSGENPR